MSIVSRGLDFHTIYPISHPVKAVRHRAGAPEPAPQYAFPAQKAHFNVSKGIAKPFIYNTDIDVTPGRVPLKSNQYGSHAGGMLFNAPEKLDIALLKTPVPVPTRIRMDDVLTEYDPLPPVYTYNEGIRPSMRPLMAAPIAEPGPPIVFRTNGATLYEQLRTNPTPVALSPEDMIAKQVRGLY